MILKNKLEATLYHYFDKDPDPTTRYEILCIGGLVEGIQAYDMEYTDDGDAENGPHLTGDWSRPRDLQTNQVWSEEDLVKRVDEIIRDGETYTAYCNIMKRS